MNQWEKTAILFYYSNKPPAHSFLPSTTTPTENDKEECEAQQKLHSCVCTQLLPSYFVMESNLVLGLACKSSDTDSVIGYSYLLISGTSRIQIEVNIHVLLQLLRPASPATNARNPSGLMAFLNRVELSFSQSDTTTHVYTAFPNLFAVLIKKKKKKAIFYLPVLPSHPLSFL